ncbi:uncharacterized protein G2W53_044134 [Senna tora]|uniref:Uncharacterized protein n=1 Tax=Senna tora TaxID=362788 RepID=A0A834W0T6_9FABA|nr:uncharacterized protein G2W53_044134 [Senna tora]
MPASQLTAVGSGMDVQVQLTE